MENTRDLYFPPRIKAEISEYAPNLTFQITLSCLVKRIENTPDFHLDLSSSEKNFRFFINSPQTLNLAIKLKFSKNLKFLKKSEIFGFEKFNKNYLIFLSYLKMENIISYSAWFTKKQVDSAKKAISKFVGWVINLVPGPIRRTVKTGAENLNKKIKEIFENKKKLPQNAAEESSTPQEVITTGESSNPQEVITNKTEIKLVENGGRVKVFKTTGNLNFDLTDIIMKKITPIIEMRTKVIHAFSCVISRGQGEIIEYSKTFKAPSGTFSSLSDIKEYIHQCEQKRLDLEDSETWSKAYYLPPQLITQKGFMKVEFYLLQSAQK